MRVNIYAEEMTDRVEIIGKEIDGHNYTGLRLYLELPVTHNGENVRGRSCIAPVTMTVRPSRSGVNAICETCYARCL